MSEDVEYQGIKFKKSNTMFTLFNHYCSPSEPLTLTKPIPSEKCIVLGDFNSHSPSWGYSDLNARGEELENWQTETGLLLIYEEESPDTFFSRAWKTTSNPDLTFVTSDIEPQAFRKVYDQLAGSDHRPIILTIEDSQTHTKTAPRWNYKKANWESFAKKTDILTANIQCKSRNIDKTAKLFTKAILKAAKEHIPRGARKDYIPGCTEELKLLNDNLTKARDEVEKNPTEENLNTFKEAEINFKNATIESTRTAWHEKTRNLDFDKEGKKLWNLTRALNGENNKKTAPALEDESGKILNQKQAANCFASQYKKVSEIDTDPRIIKEVKQEIREHKEPNKYDTDEIMYSAITHPEMEEAIKSLKTNKSPGPDEITNEMITHLGTSSKYVLKKIFNASWKLGKLPQAWKNAIMIPIKKDGKPANKPASYRPISLTSCLGKLLERIINSRLMYYLEKNHLLSDEQAGFRKCRSTEDQITYIAQKVEDAFQEKKQTIVVWVDMEKAFDKVWNLGLQLKLKRKKVTHNMYTWIKNYMHNRKFRVDVQGGKSRQNSLKNGVPQGGVLSPTLFLLFVDDIKESLCKGVKAVMYADDLALLCSEEYIGTAKARIQTTLDNLDIWTRDWCMKVNAQKTTYTTFTLSTKKSNLKLSLGSHQLQEDTTPRYLGVHFDPRLSWKNQTENCQSKGMKRMQLIRKLAGTTWGAHMDVLKKTYLGYVRPVLEYGASAWGTCSKSQIGKIEKVHNQCMRVISGGMKTTPINAMESHIGLQSMTERIEKKMITQSTKIKSMKQQPLHDRFHKPVGKRLKRTSFISTTQTIKKKLGITATLKEESLQIQNPCPPWKRHLMPKIITSINGLENKQDLTKATVEETITKTYHKNKWIRVFTDGSATNATNGGAGAYIQWQNESSTELAMPVGTHCSTHKAEETAILSAVECLLQDRRAYNAQIVLLTDAKSVLQSLRNPRNTCLNKLTSALLNLGQATKTVVLQWIPGHINIKGNEHSDYLAKQGAQKEQGDLPVEFHDFKLLIQSASDDRWQKRHPHYKKT